MIEKRQKYFRDQEKTYNLKNETVFVVENKELMISLARLLYQIKCYYKYTGNKDLRDSKSSIAKFWNKRTKEEQKEI